MRVGLALLLLSLAACSSLNYKAGEQQGSRVHVVKRGETLYSIAWRYGVDDDALARWNHIADPNLIYVGQRLRLTPPADANGRARRRAARAAAKPAAMPAWQWPTNGKVVTRFGSSADIASGIGIGGHVGQPIDAAAAGKVVYAGSGLIGYGHLVIIKHNDTYLSAYGHNKRLLVHRGEHVDRGQEIALMGRGPNHQPRLHFEIRRNGKPVDPLKYLR
jgi:lipoprotein NlpD